MWPRNATQLNSSLRSFFFSYISFSLSSEYLFGNIPGISTTSMQPCKELSRPRFVTSNKQQISPEMLISIGFLKWDTNLSKELNYTLLKFKALLQLYMSHTQKECNWSDLNMVKVTQNVLQCQFLVMQGQVWKER